VDKEKEGKKRQRERKRKKVEGRKSILVSSREVATSNFVIDQSKGKKKKKKQHLVHHGKEKRKEKKGTPVPIEQQKRSPTVVQLLRLKRRTFRGKKKRRVFDAR